MVNFIIIVVSDSVYYGKKSDVSGELAIKILKARGHKIFDKIIVPNSYREIYRAIIESLKKSPDAIIIIGGTGPSPRDITIDVVKELSWRELPGFGELFRMLSYNEIGARGIISRAGMFLIQDVVVIVTPGSPSAVKLALEKIVVEIIDHVVSELRRFEGEHRI